MVSRSKGDAPAGSGEWYENELREAKARLHKVESELAQALKQTYALESEVRKLMEALAVSGSVEASLQAFREEVRQMKGQLGRVEDRQSAINSRIEQVTNQRQAESSRGQQDLALLNKQMEAVGRVIDQYDGRMKALEEISRHVEEDVAGNRLSNQAIERMMEETNTRTARTLEASLRLDQEFNRYGGQIEKLEKSDENLSDRMTLFLDQLRRALERLDKLESFSTFTDEVREALQKADFEHDQMVQRVGQAERHLNDMMQQTEEFGQLLARLDQRTQMQGSEIVALGTQIQDAEEQIKTGLKKVYQTFLRQRRRRSEALNQEIKELTQGELHATE